MTPEEKTSLNISIGEKDPAKEIQNQEGKSVVWDSSKKEWYWPGTEDSVPKELQKFLYPGKGPVLDFVLTCSNEQYKEIKENPSKAGRIRWEESLPKAVWRGRTIPKPMLGFQAKERSFEALASLLLNRVEEKPKKTPPQLGQPEEDHILVGSGPGNPRTLFHLDFENAHWLFPWRETQNLKPLFENKLPPILVQGVPSFPAKSQAATPLIGLIQLAPKLYFLPPKRGSKINPLHTYIYLPIWSRKYRKKLTLSQFPSILKAFKITTEGTSLHPIWVPSENDTIYFQTLFTP